MDIKVDRRTARAESFKRKVLSSAKEEAFDFIQKNIENLISLIIINKKLLVVIHEAIRLSESVRGEWVDISKRLIKRIANNVEHAKVKNLARNPNCDPQIVASVLFMWRKNISGKKYWIRLRKVTK